MLALDVKLGAFETLKVALCLAKQCLSFYVAVGCGSGGSKWVRHSCWRMRRKFVVHWKCSCAAAPTIPTAVKYRLLLWGAGFAPLRSALLCCSIFYRRISNWDWITALKGSPPNLTAPDVHAAGVQREREHIFPPPGLYMGGRIVVGSLKDIRSLFRYFLTHIKA